MHAPSQVDLFGGKDDGKGGEEVAGGEVEDETKDDGDGQRWQSTPHHAQQDGRQAQALQGETLQLAAAHHERHVPAATLTTSMATKQADTMAQSPLLS